jgi:hypothetical protein
MVAVMATPHPAKLEHPVVAALYDAYMWPQERMGFRRQRQRMAGEARGRVLEVAAGTGLTFPFYTRAEEVIAIDSDPAIDGCSNPMAASCSSNMSARQAGGTPASRTWPRQHGAA